MKIKLTIHDLPDKDYITLDPSPMEGPAFTGNFSTLDGVCEQAECVDLLAESFLDYVPQSAIEATIQQWCLLLRHGGKITVGGTNANDICRLFVTKNLEPQAFAQAVYGQGIKKAGIYAPEYIETLLQNSGIKITRKAVGDGRFVLEGIRP